MSQIRHVAVIDIGKTNAKLVLVDTATLTEIALETRPNTVLADPPWPHFDLDSLWTFFTGGLARLHREHGIDAISVTTHGASAVLLDRKGGLAAPMLDYEFHGPDELRAEYDLIRPPFAETGSPPLGRGLNLGAQLHWQFRTDPGLLDRVATVVTYPQYWGYRLTGQLACDVSSLGCHTDLWKPWQGTFSGLVDRLGLAGRMVVPQHPAKRLGVLRPGLCSALGLRAGTPVSTGIHDSNASLLAHLMGREAPFSVVSTGTWLIAMSVGGDKVTLQEERDTLVNVSAFGDPVPSARFMGGREFEAICGTPAAQPSEADFRTVIADDIMLLPAVEAGSGPFQGRKAQWTKRPGSPGEQAAAAAFYVGLMTETCLRLVGANGPAIIEGPLSGNAGFLTMLSAMRPAGVEATLSATGTSVGAALLLAKAARAPATRRIETPVLEGITRYARAWFDRVADGRQ